MATQSRPSSGNGFSLVELLLALGLTLIICGGIAQIQVGLQRSADLAMRVMRERRFQDRSLDLIRSDVLRSQAIGLDGAATGPCGLGGRQSVLELQTEAGTIVYSQGPPPSSIWRGKVLMRCGPAFSLTGEASLGQFQNRVLIDGLQSEGFTAKNLDGTRLQLHLSPRVYGSRWPIVLENGILTTML
jgi:type II secretory pathway pseudopilin PulG